MIQKVQIVSEKADLYLNLEKTKVMSNTGTQTFKLDDTNLKIVSNLIFLGSTISDSGDCEQEIRRRIGMGKTAMSGMIKVWKDKNISVTTKDKISQITHLSNRVVWQGIMDH